jgi:hypothetical protein
MIYVKKIIDDLTKYSENAKRPANNKDGFIVLNRQPVITMSCINLLHRAL